MSHSHSGEITESTVSMPQNNLKYLIVMPRFIGKTRESYLFPLGIPYISSSLKNAGFQVYTLNLNHLDSPYKELQQLILKEKIDVILCGGLSPQFSQLKEVFDSALEVAPDIITVCGGGIITGDPEPAMKAFNYLHIGIIGEGENTVCKLAAALNNNTELHTVKGIIFKSGSKYITTPEQPEQKDIDVFPFPDYEGFDYDNYLEYYSNLGLLGLNIDRTLSIVSSRSCPFNCSFCFHTSGKKYRQRSIDSIFNELDHILSKYSIRYLFIQDELFSSSFKRVNEFCQRIVKYNLPWAVSLRVDSISEELISLMKESGCNSIGMGLESADNTVLKSMRKHITIEQIEKALQITQKYGYPPNGNFIFGDTAETRETAQNTLNWWKKHKDYNIFLKMIRVLPGSYLYQYAREKDIIKDPVKFLQDGCPYVNVTKMTDKEMAELTQTITAINLDEVPLMKVKNLISYEPKNHIFKFNWECAKCGHDSKNEIIKLFQLNFIKCPECSCKYNVSTPDEIIKTLDRNILQATENGNKLAAFWGMANYTLDFLTKSQAVHNSSSYLIDMSQFKHGLEIAGKKIHSPEIIKQKKIDTVIILIPVFSGTIRSYIKEHYKETKNITNITDFL